LLDPEVASRREALIAAARSVYLDPDGDASGAAHTLLAAADARGVEAKESEQAAVEGLELPAREADQRVRRAQFGAEREELLAGLEGLEAWYRDLVVVSAGAEAAVVHADRLDELREDTARGLADSAVEAAEVVRETWRALEEFNLNATLALEALFIRLRRAFAGTATAARA
jgi:hypothetical protein